MLEPAVRPALALETLLGAPGVGQDAVAERSELRIALASGDGFGLRHALLEVVISGVRLRKLARPKQDVGFGGRIPDHGAKFGKPFILKLFAKRLRYPRLDIGQLASLQLAAQHSVRVMARVRWESSHRVKGARSFYFDIVPQRRQEIGMVSAPATFFVPGSEH